MTFSDFRLIQAGYKQDLLPPHHDMNSLLNPSCCGPKQRGENIQPQNKRVSIGRLPGRASRAPRVTLLAVALTCQSPAANAM